MERRPGLDFRTRLTLAGAAFLAAVGLEFGSGQGPEVVHAESPTPTPTPTRTATPSPTATPDLVTRIAAEQTRGADLQKQSEELKKLRALETRTAQLQEEIDALNGTPTRTPTPTITGTPTSTFTPTPTFTKEQREIKKQAGILPTDTPTPGPRPTEAIPSEQYGGTGNSKEIPWGPIAAGVTLAGGGVYGISRLRNRAERRREERRQRELGIRQ